MHQPCSHPALSSPTHIESVFRLDVHVAEYKNHLRRYGLPNVVSDLVNCYISDAVVVAVWTLAKMELISCVIRLLGTCKWTCWLDDETTVAPVDRSSGN